MSTPTISGPLAPLAPTAPAPVLAPRHTPLLVTPGDGNLSTYFKPLSPTRGATQPRLAISLDALEKSGKTHWSLFTAPDPIAVIMADEGTEHVLEKARRAGKKIAGVLDIIYKDPVTKGRSAANDQLQAEWQTKWGYCVNGIEALAQDTTIRTVIMDTETARWQLCQLAFFGKLSQITQVLRTECNQAYLRTFRLLYARKDLNIILIHQSKKEYKPNSKGETEWTGKYERDGMNKIGFAVDIAVTAGWDGVRRSFYTHVPPNQATRFGPELAGSTWYGTDSGFGLLGIEVFPETILTPEIWGLG